MDDSFRLRVDRVFGSLSSSAAPSSSLWCLTDDEIERNQWKRDDNDDVPQPQSSYVGHNSQLPDANLLRIQMEDLEEGEDEEEEEEEEEEWTGEDSGTSSKPKPHDYDDEQWEIKNSIGLDSTLDYEEEEDQYDKVAVGNEKPADRLYMKDVADYGIDIDSFHQLPDSFEDVIRDPRANHIAAKIRLREDAEAAKKMDSLRVSDTLEDDKFNASEDVGSLKSILKKRDVECNELESKSQKRVRFDPECKDGSDGGEDYETEGDSTEGDDALVYHLPPDYPSGIPDYMRNPSKYTRYTFDSSDVDDHSNRQAYMDFLMMLKKSNTAELELENGSVDLPKSLTFIPQKKAGDVTMIDNFTVTKPNQDDNEKEPMLRRDVPVRIAADDTDDGEVCAMEENEPEQTVAHRSTSSRKPSRQYRTKSANWEKDESV